MRVYVEAVAVRGAGLDGWEASRAVLAGAKSYRAAPIIVPPSPLLPPNERRRTVQTVRLVLAIGAEAFAAAERDPAKTATVFSSSGGDGQTIHEILSSLASGDCELSPTRFHNSVHNAPAGYWSIAVRSTAPSTTLCCHDASFAAGLLEAVVQVTTEGRPIALVAYDQRYPEPLHSVRPLGEAFGTALILVPAPSRAAFAQVDVQVRHNAGRTSLMASTDLEALRLSTPAARSLPLLTALAGTTAGALTIDYISGLELAVAVEPMASDQRLARSQEAAAQHDAA